MSLLGRSRPRLGGLTSKQRKEWKETVQKEVEKSISFDQTMKNLEEKAQQLTGANQ